MLCVYLHLLGLRHLKQVFERVFERPGSVLLLGKGVCIFREGNFLQVSGTLKRLSIEGQCWRIQPASHPDRCRF